MPYRITYGPSAPPRAQQRDKPSRIRLLTAAWLLIFALLVRAFFPAGSAQLRAVILPDPDNITQSALAGFMADLQSGAPLGDALYAFCEEVISYDIPVSG